MHRCASLHGMVTLHRSVVVLARLLYLPAFRAKPSEKPQQNLNTLPNTLIYIYYIYIYKGFGVSGFCIGCVTNARVRVRARGFRVLVSINAVRPYTSIVKAF